MRKKLFVFLITGFILSTGILSIVNNNSSSYMLNAQSVLTNLPGVNNQQEATNYFMSGLVFIVGLLLLWVLFYKLLYPFLLKFYHPSYCKSLFWSLLILYGLGWFAIAAYILFDFGFQYASLKWVFGFLGIVWIVWFLIIIFRKEKVYR